MSIKKYIAAAAVAAVAGGGLLLAAAPAFATGGSAPAAWEPDPQSIGSITLFNAAGQPVTQGTDYTNAFAYAEATNNNGTTGAKAFIQWAFPDPAQPTSAWFQQGGFTATAYPNAGAPAPLNTAANPLNAVAGGSSNISAVKGAGTNSATAGYHNVLQLRLFTLGGAGGSNADGTYWSTDISYDPVAGTWQEIATDSQNVTYTALAAAPASSPAGTSVTLTATETDETAPLAAGSYNFFDGTTKLNTTPVAVNTTTGVATFSTTTLAVAAHNLSAVFTPTDAVNNTSSTGFATATVTGPATATTLSIPTPVFVGTPVTMTASVSDAGGPVTAGSVSFFDNGSTTAFATVPSPGAAGGIYATPFSFTAGSHSVVAKFTPNNPVTDAASQSLADAFNVLTPVTGACTNEGQVAGQNGPCEDNQDVETDVPVGTITITTPYNGSTAGCTDGSQPVGLTSPVTITGGTPPNQNSLTPSTPGCVNGVLNLGTLALKSDNSMFTTTATFQDISVTDNLTGTQSWTISAEASNLNDGAGHGAISQISGENMGLTGLTEKVAEEGSNAYTGIVTPTPVSAAAPPVVSTDTGTLGLGNASHLIASATPGLGTYTADGTITLNAPTATEAGLFTGTITFTVATS